MPGAGTLRLVRDTGDPGLYVSFGAWDSIEAVRHWKTTSEFRERIARVLAHVAEFHPTELTLVASASDGATTVT
jgi:heme-degrading monooxygenase HmoA